MQILEKTINELQAEVRLVKENTVSLIKQRDKFVSRETDTRNVLSAILFTMPIRFFPKTVDWRSRYSRHTLVEKHSQNFRHGRVGTIPATFGFHRRFSPYRTIQAASWGRDDVLGGNRIGMLFTNTIQQNIALAKEYRDDLSGYSSRREKQATRLETTQNKIKNLLGVIKSLEFKKNSIQNIQIIKPPKPNLSPIKPKTRLNVMLAAVVGLILTVFLAFFVEYISKYKSREDDQ